MSTVNFLIVEDDPDWCDAYSRAAAREGIASVWSATNLNDASKLIDDRRFAVAFVDIGLNVKNDRNIDGLRVMAKIRGIGDETSIVVVTGRSGRDVLPITRDAIMNYKVHEITSKPIEPQDLRRLVRSSIEAYFSKTPTTRLAARDALRGSVAEWEWDDRMIRATKLRHGVNSLYKFLNRLVADYLPLVPRRPGDAIVQDPATQVMHGTYWSRSIGQPILVVFSDDHGMSPHIESASASQALLGRYSVGEPLTDLSEDGLRGAVFTLTGAERSDFSPA